jgi:hypothetical protein
MLQASPFWIFVVSFYVFFVVFVKKDVNVIFFVLCSLVIFGIMYVNSYHKQKVLLATESSFLSEMEKELQGDFEVPGKIFQIHKTPRSLKYLKKNAQLADTLYDLKFIKTYDKALYMKILTYTEAFIKIHYNTMIGKYDYTLNITVLRDIRKEILNMIKSSTFVLPKVSTILDIRDIDAVIAKKTKLIQSLTFRYIRALHHKYDDKHYTATDPPEEYDNAKEERYELY